MLIRIPSWTTADAAVTVNGGEAIRATPGTYAAVRGRAWKAGDVVTVRLPMTLRTVPANDDPGVAAVAYGPVVLAGDYGSRTLGAMPKLALGSVKRRGGGGLEFEGSADGEAVRLGAFYEAHGVNYNVYWAVEGGLPKV
jgi:hypothetical protein